MNPELLPCPFCGSDNCRIEKGAVGWRLWRVECMNGPCLVSGPLMVSKLKAVQAWNRRVQPQGAPTPFTCFKCGDGNTPLYCLNCARDGWKPEAEGRMKEWNDRLEEIAMALGCDMAQQNPYNCGTIEHGIYELRDQLRQANAAIASLSNSGRWDACDPSGAWPECQHQWQRFDRFPLFSAPYNAWRCSKCGLMSKTQPV